jgi:hypothetical protein
MRKLLLIPILAMAFFVAFIPHRDYPYPVHLDEWQVMAYANHLMEQGSTSHLTNPLYGGDQLMPNQTGEIGTHVFWGAFKQITGIDWLVIFRYFPGVVYMLTVLSVFVLADRQGFGWLAAFFASLLPTTVGILGPAFLVPISLAMLFIPLALFIAFNFRSSWSYLVLSALVVAPAAIHPPTAAVLIIILAPYVLLSLKGSPRHSLGMALAVTVPFLALFPVIYRIAVPMVKRLFVPQVINQFVDLPAVIPTLGYVTVLLCLIGVVHLAWKGRRTDYGLVLGTVALLTVLALFFSLHFGTEIVYYRGLQVAMLMVSILAGAGLGVVGGLRLPPGLRRGLKTYIAWDRLGMLATLIVAVMALAIVIPARINTPYYHMIDSEDYNAFIWIRENLGTSYDKALLDPWKGMAFVGLTGKKVYSLIGERPTILDQQAGQFLAAGANETDFLRQDGVSVVYSGSQVFNPDLIEIRQDVYLLSPRAVPN